MFKAIKNFFSVLFVKDTDFLYATKPPEAMAVYEPYKDTVERCLKKAARKRVISKPKPRKAIKKPARKIVRVKKGIK